MLFTYIFIAFDSFIVLDTFFTSRFGITFVYKLPGPIIIASAFFIASKTPGAGTQFDGFIYILFIFVTLSNTTSGIFSFSSTTIPFSSSAHMFISSNVTGNTLPVIFNMYLAFSIASVKSPHSFPH